MYIDFCCNSMHISKYLQLKWLQISCVPCLAHWMEATHINFMLNKMLLIVKRVLRARHSRGTSLFIVPQLSQYYRSSHHMESHSYNWHQTDVTLLP